MLWRTCDSNNFLVSWCHGAGMVARSPGARVPVPRNGWELRSDARAEVRNAGARAEVRNAGVVSIAAVAGLLLALTSGSAHAETPEGTPGGAIGLGGRGWSAAATNQATPLEQPDFSAR